MRFRFTFVSGARAGQQVVVDKRVVRIGRDPSCDVALDPVADAAASSNHAQIMLLDNGQVLLSDLGSSNGTFIGDQKVTSAVPIATGTTITLGKDGPQLTLTIEPPEPAPAPAAAAAPAAAPQKKSAKTGCIVAAVLLLVGVPCLLGIAALIYYLSPAQPAPATGEAPAAPVEVEEEVAEAEPEPEPEAAPEPDRRSPWGKLGDGSVIELETVSKLEVAGQTMESTVTQRYTWLSRDEDEVTVRVETITAAGPAGVEQKFPLMLEEVSGQEGEEPLEERQEQVETPAGSFDATYRKLKTDAGGQETTIESWTDPDLPLPYKTISKSATLDATTVLTKLERK